MSGNFFDTNVLARRIAGRLARAAAMSSDADETIVNDGELTEAAQAFAAILKRACR